MVEEIILKHGKRGMDTLAKFLPSDFCCRAAKALLSLPPGEIVIVTGFCVNGHPETDGPIGAYFLALALKELGFSPVIATDCCKDLFYDLPIGGISHKTVGVISIERCGSTRAGTYLNMGGKDISNATAPLDGLLKVPLLTIAFGDGGNEAGMGNLAQEINDNLHIEPSVITCDYLVVATVSNWGVYGFLTYLDKLPQEDRVIKYIEHIIDLGAVDGVTGLNTPSVDGFDLTVEKEILYDLRRAAKSISHI